MTWYMKTSEKRSIRLLLAESQDWRCVYCSRTLSFSPKDYRKACHATLDHLTPLTLGGKSKLDNLVLCCRLCNTVKANSTLEEFIFGLLWVWLFKERPLLAFGLRTCLARATP